MPSRKQSNNLIHHFLESCWKRSNIVIVLEPCHGLALPSYWIWNTSTATTRLSLAASGNTWRILTAWCALMTSAANFPPSLLRIAANKPAKATKQHLKHSLKGHSSRAKTVKVKCLRSPLQSFLGAPPRLFFNEDPCSGFTNYRPCMRDHVEGHLVGWEHAHLWHGEELR